MKRKSGKIGLVVADDQLRAVQYVDGRVVTADVEVGDNFRKSLRQLLSSSSFVGKSVAVGLEGQSVLIESLVLPPGSKAARVVCSDRLKGDPVFNQQRAIMGLAEESGSPGEKGPQPSLVVMVAIQRDRIDEIMDVCRELQLDVETVECAALASWRVRTDEGLQLRVIRSGGRDMILAGRGEQLLFARIVSAPVTAGELKATLARAASALGAASFENVWTLGIEAEERDSLANSLGVSLDEWPDPTTDAVGSGLAREGRVLIDFTPAEEQVRREKRKTLRTAMAMAGACGLLVLVSGVLSMSSVSKLESERDGLQNQLSMLTIAKLELAQLEVEREQEISNESIISQANPGHRMSTLFSLISSSVGKNMTVETIKIDDIEDGKRHSKDEAGAIPRILDVRINGMAASNVVVRDFAEALLKTKAFSNVQVEASERVLLGMGVEGERFRIHARAETR